jgi:predicted transcriptional regulator
MSTILNLSEETYHQLADLAQQQHRTLEEMLRICLVVYEEHFFQQAHEQMLADGLLLPLPMLGQAAEADNDFEPEPIPGKPLSEIILEDRR